MESQRKLFVYDVLELVLPWLNPTLWAEVRGKESVVNESFGEIAKQLEEL